MGIRIATRVVWAASWSFAAAGVQAHHSYTEFDDTQTVEIEGKLLVAAWQNPHTRLEVQTLDTNNRAVIWDIETGPLNNLRRRQVPLEIFKVGDVVKVAGWPSKRSGDRMFATNLQGSGGQELVSPAPNRDGRAPSFTPRE